MKKETFWTLILEREWIQAVIWSKENDQLTVISSSKPAQYDQQDLVEVTDSCLSEAIAEYPEDETEPSKTVFAIPAGWVVEGSIQKQKLQEIREICTKLSLSPTGFVVLSEALAHSIKIEEGSPLTGVILSLSKNFVSVSIVKLGNIAGTVEVGRSVSIFEDVLEGLARFDLREPLPTRVLVMGGDEEDVDKQIQKLIGSDWTDLGDKNLRFLHTPKLEKIDYEKKAIAVSIASASELGDVNQIEYGGKQIDNASSHTANVDSESESNVKASNELTAQDIGFVVDQDISDYSVDDNEPKKKSPITTGLVRNFLSKTGSVFSGLRKKAKLPRSPLRSSSSTISTKSGNSEDGGLTREIPAGSRFKKLFFSLLVLVLLLVGGLGLVWWFLPKAEVLIIVSPKKLQADEEITLVTDESLINSDELSFLATTVNTSISETKTKATTGTITVGEKAEGRITLRNGTADSIQVSQGDVLIGPQDLEFVILESASVSAALSPASPGEATVEAQGADIGAEYNIARDETLVLDGYPASEVDAVVVEAFSGGSSTEIVAVSQNDVDVLASELSSEIRRKGIAQLESEISSGRFIPESVEVEINQRDYSAQVGDEQKELSLTMQAQISAIVIGEETIEKLIDTLLRDQVPPGFSLSTRQVESDFNLEDEVQEGEYAFEVFLSANLLPEVDTDMIKQRIKGKYPAQARGILSEIPGFDRAEINLSFRFPGRLGIIPFYEKNINVEIQAEK